MKLLEAIKYGRKQGKEPLPIKTVQIGLQSGRVFDKECIMKYRMYNNAMQVIYDHKIVSKILEAMGVI